MRHVLTANMLLLALTLQSPGRAEMPKPPAVHVESLDQALRAWEKTGSLLPLQSELQRRFASDNEDVRETALLWLGEHRSRFSEAEEVALSSIYVEQHPDDAVSMELKSRVALLRLQSSSRQDRAAFYRRAVREGHATAADGAEMDRVAALVCAAADGIQEFEGAIQEHASEIDGRVAPSNGSLSAEALWNVRLRAGARDRREAERTHVRNLRGMTAERFFSLMERDSSFRRATESLGNMVCHEERDEACEGLGAVLDRGAVRTKAGDKMGDPDVESAEALKRLHTLVDEYRRSAEPVRTGQQHE